MEKENKILKHIPINAIHWESPRGEISEKDIKALAKSIENHGLIQPISVVKENTHYKGIVGRCRFEAAKLLGWEKIPALVFEAMDEVTTTKLQLAENLHRISMHPITTAKLISKLHSLLSGEGLDAHSIMGELTKVSDFGDRLAEKTAYKYLSIDKNIDERAKKILLQAKWVGLKHCEQLVRLQDDPELQVKVAKQLISERLSVRQLATLISSLLNKKFGWKKPSGKGNSYTFPCDICGITEGVRTHFLCGECFKGLKKQSAATSFFSKPWFQVARAGSLTTEENCPMGKESPSSNLH